jgi:hypothetical protein
VVMILFISLLLFFQKAEVPLKPSDEFEIKLDYQLKQKPISDRFSIDYYDTKESGMLPYLVLNVKFLKLSDQEVKAKITDSRNKLIFNKKVSLADVLKLDIGYTDDVKDRVTSHKFNIVLISPDRKDVSRIYILIEEDGTFLVNDEVRGKF